SETLLGCVDLTRLSPMRRAVAPVALRGMFQRLDPSMLGTFLRAAVKLAFTESRRRNKGHAERRPGFVVVSVAAVVSSVVAFQVLAKGAPSSPGNAAEPCPPDMVFVRKFCIDRWESSMVDRTTGRPLSPYYPPHPKMLREVFQAWDIDRANFGSEGARAMP